LFALDACLLAWQLWCLPVVRSRVRGEREVAALVVVIVVTNGAAASSVTPAPATIMDYARRWIHYTTLFEL